METEPAKAPPRSRAVRVFRILRAIWVAVGVAFVVYLFNSCRATGFDRRVLTSGPDVQVAPSDVDSSGVTFMPVAAPSTAASRRVAFVVIPGSMVDPDAYAPLAHAVASRGHAVTVVQLPFRMARTEGQRDAVIERVRRVIQSGPPGTKWVVAGHSLGGALAARVARDHPELLSGLVLIGTSHPRDFDLSSLTIGVTKVSASNDGLASPAEVKAKAGKLPADTRWVMIDGGNHSQFSYYGRQLGDHGATTSRESQQAQTLAALLDALEQAGQTE